jgi:peptidoglycan/xylan/chitin deacetylase (PgdA/CDA1 family)
MRVLVVVSAALATLGLAAFGIFAAQNAPEAGSTILAVQHVFASSTAAAPTAAAPEPAVTSQIAQPVARVPVAAPAAPVTAPAPLPVLAPSPAPPAAATAAQPTRMAQSAPPDLSAAMAGAGQTGSNAAVIPTCDKAGALGIERVVEIDTTGGPAFGLEHFKQYDFLREHEVVLTFDDGPWPENTAAVIKALTDQCAKGTFFEIGEHAMWHPELSKMVAAAGMTIGSHTWSHKDLAKQPYAGDIEQAKAEIEMGVSAVHAAVGAPIAPFFRFPDLQQPPALLSYLGERNIATFSADLDSFDFKLHHPEQVIQSVMTKLKKAGKGMVLMHDFQRQTAEAMPELLRQLKANGFVIVHMVPRAPVEPLAKYDEMVRQQDKLSANNTRPENSVIRTISGN